MEEILLPQWVQPKVRLQVRLQQIQQQLEHATQDGVMMGIVMISITTWDVAMMEEIVVGLMSTQITVKYVVALILMEAMEEDLPQPWDQQQPIKGHQVQVFSEIIVLIHQNLQQDRLVNYY